MAIAERTAERLNGRFPFSLLSRKKAIIAEKPQVLTLKMDDVFMPSNIAFTPFGQELYGVLIARESLSDSKMTPNRHKEVELDIKTRCEKLKISIDQLSSINEQFANLIKKRNFEIDNYWTTSSLQK